MSLRRVVLLLVGAFVAVHFVLPQIAGARHALDVLKRVEPGWLVAGTVVELLSVLAYAELTRSLIPAGQRPGLGRAFQITLTTLGVSHLVPGGSAAGVSLGYRLLTDAGVEADNASFALGSQGLGSALVLNVILWVALVISIPARGFNPLYATAAIVGALLFAVVGGAVLMATRGEDRAVRIVCATLGRTRLVKVDALANVLRGVAERLRAVLADRATVRRALAWATVNWLLDAAALGIFIAAFRGSVGIDGLLISYGLANVLAAIPITPGGLGIVEATLTATLVGFGVTRGVAVVAVVAYRLAQFWLPIPLAGYAYLALRWDRKRRRREVLHDVAEQALEQAPSVKDWAAHMGLTRPTGRSESSED